MAWLPLAETPMAVAASPPGNGHLRVPGSCHQQFLCIGGDGTGPQTGQPESPSSAAHPSELTHVHPSLLHSDFVVWLRSLPLLCKPRVICAAGEVSSGLSRDTSSGAELA